MKLKELRENLNKNQNEIAIILGTTQSNYSKYEKETISPDLKTLIRIADYYGVSLDYLCDHETKTQLDLPPLTETKKQAIKMLANLNETNFINAFTHISGLYLQQTSAI